MRRSDFGSAKAARTLGHCAGEEVAGLRILGPKRAVLEHASYLGIVPNHSDFKRRSSLPIFWMHALLWKFFYKRCLHPTGRILPAERETPPRRVKLGAFERPY